MTVATIDEVLQRYHIADIGAVLHDHLMQQRWFGGKERHIDRIDVDDVAELSTADPICLYLVVRIQYTDADPDLYSVPLGIRSATHPMAEVDARHRITTVEIDGTEHVVYDALADNDCSFLLWKLMSEQAEMRTARQSLRAAARDLAPLDSGPKAIRLIPGEQSNTSMARGSDEFLKWVRRIDAGPSVELEMIDALRLGGFTHMATPLGGIDYIRSDEAPTRIAFLQRFLQNASEGWALALTSLRDLYATAEEAENLTPTGQRAAVAAQGSAFMPEAARLGEVTAEMHLALAWRGLEGNVAPVQADRTLVARWADTMVAELDRLLDSENPRLDELRGHRDTIADHFERLRGISDVGMATRIHGDFHLGQVLRTDAGWIILDFEGEPARPSAERRLRSSPLRDVAGMLRSFDYAAAAALTERTSPTDPLWADLAAQGDVWAQANREAYWRAYVTRFDNEAHVLPEGDDALVVRQAFEIQKAVYEVVYELGHRPEWVGIPLWFLTRVGA